MRYILSMFFFSWIFWGCLQEDETVSESDSISDDPVMLLVKGQRYDIASTIIKKTEKFNKAGYSFFFLDTTLPCETTEYILGAEAGAEIFLEADNLAVGKFSASGPFIGSTSYFGADVEILAVNEGTIIAKVSGGDKKNNEFIEGKFSGNRCD